MQSVPITSNVMAGVLDKHYVIKFVGDLRQVSSFSGHSLLDTAKHRMSEEELANVVWAFSSKFMH